MIRLWILAGLSAAALQAQPAITAPLAGIIRDRSGLYRRIVGVSGNFVAGEYLGDDVVTAALAGEGLMRVHLLGPVVGARSVPGDREAARQR